jgi:hypothetical protein
MKNRVTPRVFDADESPQLVETVSIRGGETGSWCATASIGRPPTEIVVIPQRLAEARDGREAAGGTSMNAFDDHSITSGRVVTGTNPQSARSAAERAVKLFDTV